MGWVLKTGKRVATFGKEQVAHLSTFEEFKEHFKGKFEDSELKIVWKEIEKSRPKKKNERVSPSSTTTSKDKPE